MDRLEVDEEHRWKRDENEGSGKIERNQVSSSCQFNATLFLYLINQHEHFQHTSMLSLFSIFSLFFIVCFKQQQSDNDYNNNLNPDHTLQQQQLESIDNLRQSHLAELGRMKAILEKQQRLTELSAKKIDKEKQQKSTLLQCKKTLYELEMAQIEERSQSVIEALERKEKEAKSNKARIDQ